MSTDPNGPNPEPNWGPLKAAGLSATSLTDWMWMGQVEHDGVTIQQYKNYWTRRYVSIDQHGQAWQVLYGEAGGEPIIEKVALADALTAATG